MLTLSRRAAPAVPDMRRGRDATPEDWREYDAFGPWVDPVRSLEEMPPRFRSVYAEHEKARFLLKVPVDAERLDLRPGMSLYRQVLAVHEDRLCLMHLDETGEVACRSIGWEAVAAVESGVNLLVARWSLLLRSGEAVSLSYKAVSARRLDTVGEFIRDRLISGSGRRGSRHVAEPDSSPEAIPDLFYRGLFIAVRNAEVGPVRPLHFEPRDRVCRDDDNRFRLSTGVLVLDTRNELIIADRGAATRRFFHPTYASRFVYLPFGRIDTFALVPPPVSGKRRFYRLILRIDRQEIVVRCLVPPDAVLARLAERGVARSNA